MLWWRVDPRVSVMAWVSVGWGLISMKVPCCSAAVVMAWLNRTGWRTLSTQYWASNVGVGVSAMVEMNRIVGLCGAKSASAERNSGRIGSISAVCEATSMFTRRAKRS